MKKLPDGRPVRIYCPQCQDEGRGAVSLIVRTNRQNQSQFVGCPNWPECSYSQSIPESIRMELMGFQRLF